MILFFQMGMATSISSTIYATNLEASNVESPEANVESSKPNMESSEANVESSKPNVESSAVKVKRGKMNQQQLHAQIIAVCRDEYKSIEEIAKGVGKTMKYLNNGVISKMVSEGLLDRKYPKIPTHPEQQYKAHPINDEDNEPILF